MIMVVLRASFKILGKKFYLRDGEELSLGIVHCCGQVYRPNKELSLQSSYLDSYTYVNKLCAGSWFSLFQVKLMKAPYFYVLKINRLLYHGNTFFL